MNEKRTDGEAVLVEGEDVAAGTEPLWVRVDREIREGHFMLPVLPRVAFRVQTLIEEDAGTSTVVEAIERDPSIAAALMRYANSVAYAGYNEVTDLQQAVMRLGYKPVQQVVLALSARSAFKTTDIRHAELYRTIWTHSVATALAARRLAPRARVSGETAFLAGLLHDIGKVLILECLATMRRREPGLQVEDGEMLDLLAHLHCAAGDFLCEAWDIPGEIRHVVQMHHDAGLPASEDLLLTVVQVANAMATKIGASLHPDLDLELLEMPGVVMLGLNETMVKNMLSGLKDDCRTIARLF